MEKQPLLFTVGPVEMDKEILNVGARVIPYFRTGEFSDMLHLMSDALKEISYTNPESKVLFLTSSGTGAMEAVVQNVFTERDKVLIVDGGAFGHRFVLLCQTLGIPHTAISLPMGRNLTLNDLSPYREKGYTGLMINAHETSTGVYYDLPMIGQFCKEENMLFVVDAISSFLADPYYMDKWFIDITILSSQKALALAPGISIVIVNKRTQEMIQKNKVSSVYFDLKNYLSNMENGQTPFTPAIGILLQLNKRLEIIKKAGVETIVNHTRDLAIDFREKIKTLPFTIPSDSLSNALTPLSPKSSIDSYAIFLHLKNRYNVFINPNGGELKNTLFRVGHLGNLNFNDNTRLINIFLKMVKEGLL